MTTAWQELEEALKLGRAAILSDSPEEQLELLRDAERHLQEALARIGAGEPGPLN